MISPPFHFHWYDNPVPVLAFNVTELPEQKVVGPLAVMVAVGVVFTVTAILFDVVLPQVFVTTQV